MEQERVSLGSQIENQINYPFYIVCACEKRGLLLNCYESSHGVGVPGSTKIEKREGSLFQSDCCSLCVRFVKQNTGVKVKISTEITIV